MKIAIIGTAFPYRGGLADFNERLAQEMQNDRHQVDIYTFSLQYPNFIFPGKSQYRKEPKPTNLQISRVLSSVNPFSWIKTGQQLKKKKYDLLIIPYWLPFMSPCLSTVAYTARKNSSSKIISIVHNMTPHERRLGDRFFSKLFIQQCDAFIALSKSVLTDINSFNSTKPKSLSPHPVYDNFGKEISKEEALKNLSLDPNFSYILFFGLIRDYKGLDLLLKALPTLKNQNVKLIIAGEYYSNKEYYQSIIKQNNLENKVIEINQFIPNDEVKNYFCVCDLVVQPYKSATQSGVTQIAYHFNKPMIVTNVGGLKEMCPNNKVGYVVEPNHIQVGKAINRFFEEADIDELTHNILKEKKKYSWKTFAKEVYSLSQKITTNEKHH